MKKETKKIKIFLGVVLVSILIIFSELVYTLNENGDREIGFYLKSSEILNNFSLVGLSLKIFNSASYIKQKKVAEQYPGKSMTAINHIALPKNKSLEKELRTYLKSVDFNNLKNETANIWAKVFYDLAIISHKNNEKILTGTFLANSVSLSPEWSYFHIELANFYLVASDLENYKKTIEYCKNFEYPKKACTEFDETIKSNNMASNKDIGFLESAVHEEIKN